MNVIEANDLGKRYGSTWALRECTLAVPERHLTALVGPNGAGKTTLLNLAVGLTDPSSGTISVLAYILAAGFAGLSQINNSNPSFGQGSEGYAKRYLASVADQDIGNFMTEAIMPSLFHQDPRYFRKGHGSVGGRILYAASRVIVTKGDSGNWQFNASEFVGNGIVAAIGNAYYPDAKGFDPTMQRMFTQIGTDAVSQVLKEFWPDVKKHLIHKRGANPQASGAD